MRRVFCGLLIVFLFSFVVAGSEINANFIIAGSEPSVGSYVPSGYWNNYGSYVVGGLAILVIGYFGYRMWNKTASKKRKSKIFKKVIRKKR